MIRIRPGTPDDIPAILPMLVDFAEFAETKHSLYPGDEVATRKVIELMSGHVFMVAEDVQVYNPESPVIGFIAGLLTEHWMNPGLTILSELLWWVDPASRGSRAGALLLKEFMDFGEENAHAITMSLERMSPVKPDTLEARGFHLHETTYLKEIHT